MATNMTLVERRQQIREEDERYRVAAARISGGTVRELTTVNRPHDGGGAWVEVVVWVPESAL